MRSRGSRSSGSLIRLVSWWKGGTPIKKTDLPRDPAPPGERFLLVDASSLIFRAYYALPEISGKSGRPVQGVLGFLNMLFRLADDLAPGRLAVCYDGGMSRREEAFPEYKANRTEAPDDLLEQFVMVGQAVEALGLHALYVEETEADDVLATASRLGEEAGLAPRLVTGDKDLLQLVTDRTHVLFTRRGVSDLAVMTPESFRERYHIDPTRFPDFKALLGDKSDNLPGVTGVGEATAIQLLRRFGSLEEILGHVGEVRGHLAMNLSAQADQARLTRRLATLDRHVPLPLDLEAARFSYGRLRPEGVETLLGFGLRALAERLAKKIMAAAREARA